MTTPTKDNEEMTKEDDMLDHCKNELAARLRDENVIAISERGGQYVVERWSATSVFPCHKYETKQKAASRVLQLLGIGPVSPQTWPEETCLGSISVDGSAGYDRLGVPYGASDK